MSAPDDRPSAQHAPTRQRSGVCLALAACCWLLSAYDLSADQPAKTTGPGEPAKSDSAVQPAANEIPARTGIDQFKLPSNSIVVICEEAKDALRLVPRGFLISPEEYQKLVHEIARLKGQPKAGPPATPTACRLTGRVEGDLVRLQAEFEFRTDRRGALIALSCGQAHPSAVTLNGQVPVLHFNAAEGYVLQVDEPGPHRATLDLELAAAARGAGTFRGFDLDLPRAPVTTLDLELPATVKEVRLGKTTFPTRPTEDRKHSRLEAGGLGPLERLELSWKGPVTRAVGPALLTADGRITVQVHETFVETTAEITLNVLRGQTQQWQLLVPPQASLEVLSASGESVSAVIEQVTPKSPLRTIRLKEATAEPHRAVLQLQQPRGQGPVPVGPFHVLNTFRQRGSILVGSPTDVRLRYLPRSEVTPREVTADDGRSFKSVAAFSYWNLPTSEKPQALPPPLLNLEFETVKGLIETQTHQALELTESGWRVGTKFLVTPARGGAVELPVELPAGYELEGRRRPGDLVQEVRTDPDTRETVIVLSERQTRPFEVTLDGRLPAPAAGVRLAALELPRLIKSGQTLDRGGTVTLIVPADQELISPSQREGVQRSGHNRQAWKVERTPGRIEVGWQPHRLDLPIDGIVDVTLTGTQAFVRHRLWASTAQGLPRLTPLRVPEAVADRLQEVERGRLVPAAPEDGSRTVELTDQVTRATPLVLHYSFPLPTRSDERGTTLDSQPFVVPLLVPEQATRGETRVRVWSDPGSLPLLANDKWEELPLEVVPDRDRLPDLCLRGARPDLPLLLRLTDPGTLPQDTVLIERALIRATVLQAGQHSYWASFRISHLRAPYLDLELPAAPAGLGLKVYLDGLPVKWGPVPDNVGTADGVRLARLKIGPELVTRPAVLDVVYQLTPNQPAARGTGYAVGNVALQTTLYPPELRGCRDHVSARWDVRLPSGWVPLYTGDGFQFEQRWGWRGWLLAPRPAVSGADLEDWFSSGGRERASPAAADGASETGTDGPPSVVCWKTDLEPLRLHHAPQQAWLLVCSLGVLVIGLGLYFLLVHRGLYWPVVVLLGVAAALIGLIWPNVLAVAFYGSQPGLAVLLLVLGFQWFLHRRYRRQVVFLPGFTRLKGNSSLIRGGRARGEPSTVDEPPVGAGSQRKGGSSVSRGESGSQPGTAR